MQCIKVGQIKIIMAETKQHNYIINILLFFMSECLLLCFIPIDTVKISIALLALFSLIIPALDQMPIIPCIFVLFLNRKLGLMYMNIPWGI